MSLIKEFKAFIMKGNIVELAVAVIIGSAFGAIVTSFVNDVITPLLLTPALKAAKAEDLEHLTWGAVRYGQFLSAIITFLVIAFVLFMLMKASNTMKKKEENSPSEPSSTDKLLMEIRDKLK